MSNWAFLGGPSQKTGGLGSIPESVRTRALAVNENIPNQTEYPIDGHWEERTSVLFFRRKKKSDIEDFEQTPPGKDVARQPRAINSAQSRSGISLQ